MASPGADGGAAAALVELSVSSDEAGAGACFFSSSAAAAAADTADSPKPCVFWHLHYAFPAQLCKPESDAHRYPTLRDMLVQTLSERSAATVAMVHQWLVGRQLNYADARIPAIEMMP